MTEQTTKPDLSVTVTGYDDHAGEMSCGRFSLTVGGLDLTVERWATRNASGEEWYDADEKAITFAEIARRLGIPDGDEVEEFAYQFEEKIPETLDDLEERYSDGWNERVLPPLNALHVELFGRPKFILEGNEPTGETDATAAPAAAQPVRWRLLDPEGIQCDIVDSPAEVGAFVTAMLSDGLAYSVEEIR